MIINFDGAWIAICILTVSSYSSIFNHTLNFEDCVTSVLCSSPMNEGGCVIQYGLNSSYQDLGPSVSILLNTVPTLPNIASSTLYYFTMNVTIGSTSFQLRRTFSSGNGEAKTLPKCNKTSDIGTVHYRLMSMV